MESRIAILGIFVYELDSANKINDLLHKYSRYIIGRMGIPIKISKYQLCLLSLMDQMM